jgi:hypothetical protein
VEDRSRLMGQRKGWETRMGARNCREKDGSESVTGERGIGWRDKTEKDGIEKDEIGTDGRVKEDRKKGEERI